MLGSFPLHLPLNALIRIHSSDHSYCAVSSDGGHIHAFSQRQVQASPERSCESSLCWAQKEARVLEPTEQKWKGNQTEGSQLEVHCPAKMESHWRRWAEEPGIRVVLNKTTVLILPTEETRLGAHRPFLCNSSNLGDDNKRRLIYYYLWSHI